MKYDLEERTAKFAENIVDLLKLYQPWKRISSDKFTMKIKALNNSMKIGN